MNYINQLQFEREYFFENDQWWFWINPVNWYRWVKYSLEIHHYKLLLASLVAENPEREQVIYSIFSSENLITFDEIGSVIDGFGNEYFIDVYKKMLVTDKRPRLKKYIRYFLGKLYLAEGNELEATKYFQEVLADAEAADEYQSLLYARVFEGLALASSSDEEKEDWTLQFYKKFPQLVPFSDLTMSFRLEVSGQIESEGAQDVLGELKNCNLDFASGNNAPVVSVQFSETNDSIEINYSVQSVDGTAIMSQGTLRMGKNDYQDGGKLLAYRLFHIHKTKIGEKPEAVKTEPMKTPV